MEDRKVLMESVQKFLELTNLFQREFRGAFSELIEQSTENSEIDVTVVRDAFMLACQRCLSNCDDECSTARDADLLESTSDSSDEMSRDAA